MPGGLLVILAPGPQAATLLVGLWLGSQAIMAQDYDCVSPAFLVRLLRVFPTQSLTKNWMGNDVKSLVLSQSRQPKQPKPTANSAWTDQGGFLEWDVLTVYNDLDMNDGTYEIVWWGFDTGPIAADRHNVWTVLAENIAFKGFKGPEDDTECKGFKEPEVNSERNEPEINTERNETEVNTEYNNFQMEIQTPINCGLDIRGGIF